jgi:histidyl-tRNA synthetase
MAEVAGVSEHLNAITNTLDKLDKIGTERVLAELQALPIGEEAFAGLRRFTEMATAETIDWDVWNEALGASATGREGLAELRSVLTTVASADTQAYASLRPHLLLARGLDYYTGTIFEAQLPGSGVGSIGSGGRYDHLTEVFGLPNMPGIGVSFGLDRLVEALSSLGKLEAAVSPAAQVLVAHTGDQTLPAAMGLAARLRAQDLAVEVYPEAQKLKKQLAYADKKQIPFVLIPGAEEQARGEVQLKNLATGEQRAVKTEEAVAFFVGAKA